MRRSSCGSSVFRSRPTLEEIKVLLEEIGAGTVVARHLPGGLRGAHIRRGDGGYVIHHIPDDWRGATEHTLMHETYEIIYETLYGSYEDPATARRVCREANRFAAAVLMPAATFEAFAVATGLDILSLQKRFQCSYASVALRLGEVLSRRPLLAVLYERREEGDPWDVVSGAGGERFQGIGGGAHAGIRGAGIRTCCAERGVACRDAGTVRISGLWRRGWRWPAVPATRRRSPRPSVQDWRGLRDGGQAGDVVGSGGEGGARGGPVP